MLDVRKETILSGIKSELLCIHIVPVLYKWAKISVPSQAQPSILY